MHQAQHYINNSIFGALPIKNITSKPLNIAQESLLLKYLYNDALSYLYSATVSVGNAIQELENKMYTWATVKLYYTTFYALRSYLALEKICIFYIHTSPFSLFVRAGEMAKKEKGNTHKTVLNVFKDYNPGHILLSQDIDSEKPLDWLTNKREKANYKNAKFYEPNTPIYLKKIVKDGVRKVINTYWKDDSYTYLFDADHAILAYPIKTVRVVYDKIIKFPDVRYSDSDIQYLAQLFKDQKGKLPELYNMVMTIK